MYKSLVVFFNNKYYKFQKFLGILYASPDRLKASCISEEEQEMLNLNNNPYLLKRRNPHLNVYPHSFFIKMYAKFLRFLCSHCYFLVFLISHLRLNIYDNAGVASEQFRKIFPDNQNVLCFPRAIFTATTSKRFAKHGLMIIGIFFPNKNMHAWIIEDGMLADVYDSEWLMYTPILIMK